MYWLAAQVADSAAGRGDDADKQARHSRRANSSLSLAAHASSRLCGHSGPVYSVDFSPDHQFVFSCSADRTVRLWNLDLGANLVVYKGHSYPVWDVKCSPLGYYFASASHDRTAR
eukprot:2960248-Pyramimonas_sp.AAC.1